MTIAAGQNLLLQSGTYNVPNLMLVVQGTLVLADADISLSLNWIKVEQVG